VRGIIVDRDGPVSGVEVLLATSISQVLGVAPAVATSDASGVFDLGMQDAAGGLLVARKGSQQANLPVDLRGPFPGQDGAWLALWLSECKERARGRAVDADGRPLAGVGVSEAFQIVGGSIGSTFVDLPLSVTREDGTFDACGTGSIGVGGGRYEITPALPGPSDIVVRAAATVSGGVMTYDHRPVAGALVYVDGRLQTTTDDEGYWSASVSAECHRVWVDYRGRSRTFGRGDDPDGSVADEPSRVCVAPGQEARLPPLVLRRCAGLLLGVVQVPGARAAGLHVDVEHRSVVTGPAGDFVIDCPMAWPKIAGHIQDASPSSLQPAQIRFVSIRAWPRPVVHGSVISGERAVAGVRVTMNCTSPRDPDLIEELSAFSDLDGNYSLLAEPGRCEVTAGGPWWDPAERKVLQLTIGEAQKVDLRVNPLRHE